MAVCPSCGRENPDSAVFCTGCGSMMSGRPTAEPPSEPAAMSRMRKVGGSGAMLALALLQTVAVAVSACVMQFPLAGILSLIAFWMIYATCKKPEGSLLSTGGVTLLRVFRLLCIIFLSIGLVAFAGLCALVAVLWGAAASELTSVVEDSLLAASSSILWAFLVFGCVSLLLSLLHAIFAYRFLGSVKETATTGFAACRSAAPLAVFSVLSGLCSLAPAVYTLLYSEQIRAVVFGAISMLEDFLASAGQDVRFPAATLSRWMVGGLGTALQAVAALLLAVCAILVGVLALRYRAAMRKK